MPAPSELGMAFCDDDQIHLFPVDGEIVKDEPLCGKAVRRSRVSGAEDFVCSMCASIVDQWASKAGCN